MCKKNYCGGEQQEELILNFFGEEPDSNNSNFI